MTEEEEGSLTCAQIWVRAVHTEGGQHKCGPQGTEKLPVTLHHQGIEPRVFGFELRLSNHWATSPVLDHQHENPFS